MDLQYGIDHLRAPNVTRFSDKAHQQPVLLYDHGYGGMRGGVWQFARYPGDSTEGLGKVFGENGIRYSGRIHQLGN
jgi:hypothetical protein